MVPGINTILDQQSNALMDVSLRVDAYLLTPWSATRYVALPVELSVS